jgi:hypothetical protein
MHLAARDAVAPFSMDLVRSHDLTGFTRFCCFFPQESRKRLIASVARIDEVRPNLCRFIVVQSLITLAFHFASRCRLFGLSS